MNDVARNINTAKGIGLIQLGFWLSKKPDKTAAEKAAAKAFIKIFWITLGITLLFVVVLFILTGYVMSGTKLRYDGIYDGMLKNKNQKLCNKNFKIIPGIPFVTYCHFNSLKVLDFSVFSRSFEFYAEKHRDTQK